MNIRQLRLRQTTELPSPGTVGLKPVGPAVTNMESESRQCARSPTGRENHGSWSLMQEFAEWCPVVSGLLSTAERGKPGRWFRADCRISHRRRYPAPSTLSTTRRGVGSPPSAGRCAPRESHRGPLVSPLIRPSASVRRADARPRCELPDIPECRLAATFRSSTGTSVDTEPPRAGSGATVSDPRIREFSDIEAWHCRSMRTGCGRE